MAIDILSKNLRKFGRKRDINMGSKTKQIGKTEVIGIAREDEIKLYNDMGDFITDVENGKKPVIKNSPVVPLKAEDFREILSMCWDMAQNGADKFEGINKLIGVAEKCMV